MADLLSQVQALLANLVLKTVQFRRSFTAGYRPTVLAEGEPFVQFADRRLIFGGANGGPQVEVPFDGGGSGGPGIVSGAVNGSGHLILTRSDGSTLDVGYVVGAPGSPGASGGPGATGRGIASVVVNGSNRLIVTYTDGSTQDAGPVAGGSGGGPSNTDGLPEGTTNLYFTAGRARAAISVTGGLTYNASTGAIGYALPAPTTTTLGGVRALAAAAKTFLTGIGTDGTPTTAQPAFSDLTGTAAPAQLPTPTTTTLGGVKALAAVTSLWVRSIGADGTPTASQPAFSDLSGSVAASQLPAFTGDATSAAGTAALTLGASGVSAGSYTNANITVDAKGRVTAAASGSAGDSGPTSTDGLPEGSNNLYFTNARSRSVISATGSLAYNNTTGVISYTAPTLAAIAISGSASDLSAGTVPAARMPAHTGDVTSSAGSVALTLANSGVGAGTYSNATVTVDAKGRVTGASSGAAPRRVYATSPVVTTSGSAAQQVFNIDISAGGFSANPICTVNIASNPSSPFFAFVDRDNSSATTARVIIQRPDNSAIGSGAAFRLNLVCVEA